MKSYIYILITVLIWGSFAAVTKLTLNELDSFQVQFFMFLVALITNSIILFITGKLSSFLNMGSKRISKLFLFSLPAYLYYFFYLFSLKLIPATEASILNYIWPITTIIFSVILLNERLSIKKIVLLLIGFCGVFIILTNGSLTNFSFSNPLGDVFALLAGIFWGLFSVLGKKNTEDPSVSYFIFFLSMFILSTISLLIFSSFKPPTSKGSIGIIMLGLVNLSISYFFYFKALKTSSTSKITNVTFLTPFINLIYIAILLKERITSNQLIGLAIIVISAFLQNIKFKLILPKKKPL